MASTNSSNFPTINTTTPDKINILFRAPHTSSYLMWLKCVMCPFSCCCFENVKERLYFYVMENRIELNQPGICTVSNCWNLIKCNFKPVDNVTVIYYDKNFLQNAAKAECCKPVRLDHTQPFFFSDQHFQAFTHCSCFPNMCNLCGEAVVLYSDGNCGGCCCRSWIMVSGFEDARTVADMVNHARTMMSQRQVQVCASGTVFGPQPVVMHAPSSTIDPAEAYGYEMKVQQY